MQIKNADVFQTEKGFVKGDITIGANGRIGSAGSETETLDATGLYAIPGLVDVHFHGCVGHDFCEGTEEAIQAIADYEASVGVLAICPATMTFSEEILGGIADAAAAHKNEKGADLIGINMEGPFISPKKIGAQNPEYLQTSDVDMFRRLQKRANGLFKLCDLAPEVPGTMEFIQQVKDEVNVSIAHTCTDYETAVQAFQNGANHVTHLYNAMPGINHRMPGPIVAAAENNAYVELICDNVHIHPAVVRLTFRLFGDDKVVLIADSMEATGLPDGEYSLGGQGVRKQGRRATLVRDPDVIAGSATNLFDCMCRAVQEMDIPLASAVRAATVNPARSIGVDADYGSLDNGRWGNVLLLNKNLELVHIIQKGKLIK